MSPTLRHWHFCVYLLLVGCTAVNFDYPRLESVALTPAADTDFDRSIARQAAQHPGEAAFYWLGNGVEALAARYLLARRARQTIDVQSYLFKEDAAGSLLILALLEAADRGVRVRILVDDAELPRLEGGIAALDGHPKIDVRIWNPFAPDMPRWLNALADYPRITRRMHNKAFIADNRMAVIGGRNLAAEYFSIGDDLAFRDADALTAGPLAGQVSGMFDHYWNHLLAVPVTALLDAYANPAGALIETRERVASFRANLPESPYAGATTSPLAGLLDTQSVPWTWAAYNFVYDSPDKGLVHRPADLSPLVTPQLFAAARAVRRELLIVTPYFVPRKRAMQLFRELRARDVRVLVVTNSLASSNQKIVFSGYAAARKQLLEIGVQLHEINPAATVFQKQRYGYRPNGSTLHGKLFVADRERVFLGSFNVDPRSAYINTEMGVIIEEASLAERLVENVRTSLPTATYRLSIGDRGGLLWSGIENGKAVQHTHDPETGFWLRLRARLARLLPIKSQL